MANKQVGFRYDSRLINAVNAYQSAGGGLLAATGHLDPETVEDLLRDVKLRFESLDARVADPTSSAYKMLLTMFDDFALDCNLFASYGKIVVKADGTGDYTTIAAGITAATSGDSILLGDSTFTGEDFDCGGKTLHFRGVDAKTSITASDLTKPAFKNIGTGSTFYRIKFNRFEQTSGTAGTLVMSASGAQLSVRLCDFTNCASICQGLGSTTSSRPSVFDRVTTLNGTTTALSVAQNAYAEITNSEFQVSSSTTDPVLALGVGLSSGSRVHAHHVSVVAGSGGTGITGTATITNSVVDVNGTSGATGIQASSVNLCWVSSYFSTKVSATTARGNFTTRTQGFANKGSTPLSLLSSPVASTAINATLPPRFKDGGSEVPGANRCHFDLIGRRRDRFRVVSMGASVATGGSSGGFSFSLGGP